MQDDWDNEQNSSLHSDYTSHSYLCHQHAAAVFHVVLCYINCRRCLESWYMLVTDTAVQESHVSCSPLSWGRWVISAVSLSDHSPHTGVSTALSNFPALFSSASSLLRYHALITISVMVSIIRQLSILSSPFASNTSHSWMCGSLNLNRPNCKSTNVINMY